MVEKVDIRTKNKFIFENELLTCILNTCIHVNFKQVLEYVQICAGTSYYSTLDLLFIHIVLYRIGCLQQYYSIYVYWLLKRRSPTLTLRTYKCTIFVRITRYNVIYCYC